MGPLAGVKIVEIAGIGPGPFCAMMLGDLGAEVIRIDRPGGASTGGDPSRDVLNRNRRSVVVDLKHPDGGEVVLRLVEQADALIEGFRPGVAERLGLGPDACLERNPGLVYGRMTGWGQDGPRARTAGHDIDYIALAGALHPIGPRDRPPEPPLNLVGDFGGGGLLLAFGIVCALVERAASGKGQVVDAAMIDGAAVLTAMFHGMLAQGLWTEERGANLLDGGAPFYRVYEAADGGYVAVGALEPKFYAELLARTGLEGVDPTRQYDRTTWPDLHQRLADLFASQPRTYWEELFSDADACVAPVLSLLEAPDHPHHRARETFMNVAGVVQPAPAPRFSRTPAGVPHAPPAVGGDAEEVLADHGFSPEDVARLRADGVLG